MKPVLSVIIPAHNEEKYIARCLLSICRERIDHSYEIIVVDNNCTDKTVSVVKKFNARIIAEKKPGAGAARNAGAGAAKGDLLVFIDADCVMPSRHLDRIWQHFQKYPAVEILAGPYVVNDAGPIIRWCMDEGEYYTRYFAMQKYIFGHQGLAGGNFAIKKNIFFGVGGFDETIDTVMAMEDVEFAVRLHLYGHRAVYDKRLRVYTSFRRMKREPIRTAIVRTYFAMKHWSKLWANGQTTPQRSSLQ